MQDQQLAFLKKDLISLLGNIKADTPASWGKMNAQQMVEHLAAFFDVSTEKIKYDLVTPEEYLPKYKEFLLSEKQFRENTKAPLAVLAEEPSPVQFASLAEARADLRRSVDAFDVYFRQFPGKKTLHPVFGLLDRDEWIRLHYKHVTHHLRQFGLTV